MANNHSNPVKEITSLPKIKIISCLRDLLGYRELLFTLTLREIKVRYKQTVLGIAWAIIQPISLTVLFSIIFGKFARIGTEGVPYPIFAYSALLPWTFFATAVSFAIPSIVADRYILMKVYFPREIFPLSCVLAACIDFGFAGLIFIAMLLFYHVTITVHIIWVIPLLIIQLIFTIGFSLFFSNINVRYRDVRFALPLVLQLWMFATPIFYPTSVIPERYRMFYMLNPLAGIIDGYRRVIIKGVRPELRYLFLSGIVAVLLLIFSYRYFKQSEKEFADII